MSQRFDLDVRTATFARNIRDFVKPLHAHSLYKDDIQQLIRSSGSIGANYLEANESISRKDFLYRMKICRKESKESIFWIRLLATSGLDLQKKVQLESEAGELLKIFSSIIKKIELKNVERHYS